MKTVMKVMLGVILAIVVLVAGCSALIGLGANQAEKNGITKAQFASIRQGETIAEVKAALGKPSDSQHTQSSFAGQSNTDDCIYYDVKGDIASSYQFCFSNGKLDSKAKY